MTPRIARKFLQFPDRTPDDMIHKAAWLAALEALLFQQSHDASFLDSGATNHREPLLTLSIIVWEEISRYPN
jgi:hypothetical protein